MGLDQSIFTSSKAIAEAIRNGNTPNGKWCDACFSLARQNDSWCRIDTYAQSRRWQMGQGAETIDGGYGFSVICLGSGDAPTEEQRELSHEIVDVYGGEGVEAGAEHLYQVGLFRKFYFLDNVLRDMCGGMDFESDEMVQLDLPVLQSVRNMAQTIAIRMVAENGLEWLDGDDGWGFQEFIDFVDILESFPEAEDAVFAYNPWW